MINSSEWKEFRIGDLFYIERGTRFVKSKRKSGELPLVTAGELNQGVAEFIAYDDELKIYENHLTIDMFCNCFYRDYKFLCDDNILVLFSKNTFSNKALLFISSIINKHKIRFSFAKQFRQKDFNELKIYLPIATNGKIDFEFMENFIDKIEQKQREILEFYKQRKKDIGGGYELNSKICQEFKIGDLFLVKNNPQLNKSSFNFSKNGEYPYFTRTVFNNGILGYVDYLDEEHKIKGNSIAVGMIAMKFFYMKQDFYAGQFTKTIYPKFDNFNDKIAKYFISIFNKNSPLYLKNFVVKDFEKDFTNTTIKLPITKNGEIDFDFMENFIKAISKECIKGVDSYLVKNIALTKEVIKD